MENIASIPEPISRDVYEKYYQIIEKKSIEMKNDPHFDVTNLAFLEKIINSIERSVQDITSEENIKKRKEVSERVLELLNSWLLILSIWDGKSSLVAALNYNFLPVISILKNYNSYRYINTVRYLGKLNSQIKNSESVNSISIQYYIQTFSLDFDSKDERQEELFNNFMKNIRDKSYHNNIDFDYRNIDPASLSETAKMNILNLASDFEKRYDDDSFDLRDKLDLLKAVDVEEIRREVSEIDFTNCLEDLFQFDDSFEDAIWQMKIKVTDEENKYNAAEIGYLMWSLSKALESIDDIEVELVNWGEGSKWFDLRIKIKSLAIKVDLSQVLKKTIKGLETYYTKIPVEEIDKFEAEKNKLNAEAEKITKESRQMHEDDDAKFLNSLEIHEKLLDLQRKEIEIEDKKADVRLKNVQYLSQLSELITNGIVQNDSDIQILINEALFFKKDQGIIEYGNVDLLDVNEKIVPKTSGNIENDFKTSI
ncbi:MAG: hypothetical protein ACTHML_14710 [Ginsengibacter sp.]